MTPVSDSRLSHTSPLARWTARRMAWGLAGVLLAALPAVAADRILDVRIGRHDEFTRIVFELEASTTHQIEQRPGAQELVVRLAATSPAREILSTSDVVQAVRLEPKGGETIAHVTLRSARVRVSELTLESPARLVLDLRPGETSPAVAEATKPPALAPTAPAVRPPAPAPSAAPQPASPPSLAPAPRPAPALAVREPIEANEQIRETELLAQAETEAAADDAADAAATAAAAAPAPGAPIKPAPALGQPGAPSSAQRPQPAPGLPPATSPAPRSPGSLLPDGIDPRWLFGAVALLAAFLLWGIVGRRDRVSREVEATEREPANVFADRPTAPAPAPEPAASAVPDLELARGEAPLTELAPPSDLPLFTPQPVASAPFEPEPEAEPDDDELPVPAERTEARHLTVVAAEPPFEPEPATMFGAALTAAAPSPAFDVGSRVADLERRIALLERKLEDASDVRERLERQVVAQTEELRVQRAAIARTQRVLRTLARPDDLPIEPAPRGSGPPGSGM